MGGDEIVAKWLGGMDSDRVQTGTPAQRFSATSCRCRTALIFNNNTTHYAYVGKYYSSDSEFVAKAGIVWSKSFLKFEFVDLYELGHRSCSGAQYLQIIGINHY